MKDNRDHFICQIKKFLRYTTNATLRQTKLIHKIHYKKETEAGLGHAIELK